MSVPTPTPPQAPSPWPDCESLQAQVLEALEEGVAVLDRELRVRSWNATLAYFSGLESAKVAGKNFLELIQPSPVITRALEQTLAGKPARVAQISLEFPGAGAGGWFTIGTRPLLGEARQIIGCILVFHEVPVTREDRSALREAAPAPAAPVPGTAELLQAMMDATREVILLVDHQGRVLAINQSALTRIQRTRAEVLGRSMADFLPPAVARLRFSYGEKVLATGQTFVFEDERGGHWLENIFCPVPGPDGQPAMVAAFSRDITHRKLAQAERDRLVDDLRQSESRLRAILDGTSESVFLLDAAGNVLVANQTGAQRLNMRPEACLGRPFDQLLPEPASAKVRQLFSMVWEQKSPVTVEGGFGGLHYESTFYPVLDQQGEIKHIVSFARDITARKHAEENLLKSQLHLQTILNAAPVVMWAVDLEGLFTVSEGSVLQYLGLKPKEVLGRSVFEMYRSHPDICADIRRALAGEQFETVHETGGLVFDSRLAPLRAPDGEIIGAIGVSLDITRRIKAEHALRESQFRYQQIVETAEEGIWLVDREWQTSFVNRRMAQMLGCEPADMLGKHIDAFTDEEGRRISAENMRRREQGLRENHDFKFLRKDGKEIWVSMATNPILDTMGAFQGALAMVTDVTERRLMESRIKAISNNLAQGMIYQIIRRPDGSRKFAYLSDKVMDFYGITPAQGLADASLIYGRVHPEDLPRLIQEEEQANQSLSVFSVETRMLNPDQSLRWSYLVSTPKKMEDGSTCWDGLELDITERKRAEAALQESEAKYRRLYDSMSDALANVDMTGRIQEANPAFLAMVGYSLAELRLMTFRDITPEKWHAMEDRLIETELLAQGHCPVYEKEYRHKDGQVFPVELRSFLVRDAANQPSGMWAIVRDITERRQMLDSIRQSEERFSKAFNHSPVLMAISRLEDGLIIDANDCLIRSFGLTREQAIGKTSVELGLYEDVTERAAFVAALGRGDSIQGFEVTLRTPKGRINCLVSAVVIHLGDQPHLLSLALDITARKQAEVALRESESRLRFLFENLRDTVSRHTPDSTFSYVSPACRKLTGFEPADFIGRRAGDFVHPDEVDNVVQTILTAVRERRAEYYVCHRLLRKAGDYVWVETLGRLIYDAQGQLTEIQCAVRDISERKLVEHQILHRLKLEHAIATISARFAASGALEAAITAALADMGRLTGAQRVLLFRINEDMAWMNNTHEWCAEHIPSHQPLLQALPVRRFAWWLDKFQRDEAVQIDDVGTLAPGPHAEREWLLHLGVQSVLALPVRINGRVAGCVSLVNAAGLREWGEEDVVLLGVFTQILSTAFERDEFESALRKSEERFRSAFDDAPTGVCLISREGRLLRVNRAVPQIFGYDAAELLGMHFSQVTHPDDVGTSAQGYQGLLAGDQQTFEIEKRYIHKSGRIIWALVRVHLLRDAQGEPLYFLAHILDITARKQAEEKLKHSGEQMRALAARIETVREEDRSQIAREVHDDLGQSLTGLKLDLSWLARHLPESETESRARAAEMSDLIDSTINAVRRISSELRPSVLDDLGLIAAVEWQAQEFERRTGVPCRFRSTGEFDELEARRATALFRILQEALTNVIRHAQASRVSVKLTREIGAAQIEIRDNGRGITREELSRPGSLGLLGMRERAFAFGGEVLVTGRPGHGTTVTARMPLAGPSRDTELLTAADLLAEAKPQVEPPSARDSGRKPKRKPPG